VPGEGDVGGGDPELAMGLGECCLPFRLGGAPEAGVANEEKVAEPGLDTTAPEPEGVREP
jgi:hypothetical protein